MDFFSTKLIIHASATTADFSSPTSSPTPFPSETVYGLPDTPSPTQSPSAQPSSNDTENSSNSHYPFALVTFFILLSIFGTFAVLWFFCVRSSRTLTRVPAWPSDGGESGLRTISIGEPPPPYTRHPSPYTSYVDSWSSVPKLPSLKGKFPFRKGG